MTTLLFRLLLFAIAVGGHTVLCVFAVNRTHAYGWNRKFVDVLTLIFASLLLFGLWPLAQFAAGNHYPTSLPCLPQTAAHGYGLVAVTVAAIALAHNVWRWLHPERRGGVASCHNTPLEIGDPPQELLAPGKTYFLGTLPGNEVVKPQLIKLELSVPGLPRAFDGLTLAHLSDLHMSGRIRQAYFDHIVDATNALAADLVVVTGDIVEDVVCNDWIDQTLSRLEAQQGKLFILGNHDTKSDAVETRRRMVSGGFIDAGGRILTLQLDRGPCLIAGNEIPWFGPMPNLTSLPPREQSPGEFRLALLHTPDHFAWSQQHGFHVALAGHNHGGQIRFPILGALMSPSIYGTRYSGGVYSHRSTVLHVSRGTSSHSPLRWNCPPEVSLLTLRVG